MPTARLERAVARRGALSSPASFNRQRISAVPHLFVFARHPLSPRGRKQYDAR